MHYLLPEKIYKKLFNLKAKTFPERQSDEYDAGYAKAVEELKTILGDPKDW